MELEAGVTNFKEGQRVRLAEQVEQGIPEEFGIVLGTSDIWTTIQGRTVYVVCLDEEYRADKFDDGLREVTEDQMETV